MVKGLRFENVLLLLLTGAVCGCGEVVSREPPRTGRDWTSPVVGMEFAWVEELGLWVGKFEVTNQEYRRKVLGHDSGEVHGHSLNGERQPAVNLTFEQMREYAAWLTKRDRALPGGYRYRLPTGDEWTTIVECGDGRRYPWGNQWPPISGEAGNYHGEEGAGSAGRIADYNDGFPVTAPVDELWRSPWGLYGVGGNVAETTTDAPGGDFEGWRGGSWLSHTRDGLRSSYRFAYIASRRYNHVGFRLILCRGAAPPPAEPPEAWEPAIPSLPTPVEPEVPTEPDPPAEVVDQPVVGQDWTSPKTGMELVWIPALELWVGRHEVTNQEYRKKESEHDSGRYQRHSLNGERQPVVYIELEAPAAYAAWLTEQERNAGHLPEGYRYRLPTDDEWTILAQCGDNREYPWGNQWPPPSGQAGNYHGREGARTWPKIEGYFDGFPVTAPVDELWRNPWGLRGVGGNVWEITTRIPNGDFEAWRGGSWSDSSQAVLRCLYRETSRLESYRTNIFGFRLVLSATDQPD